MHYPLDGHGNSLMNTPINKSIMIETENEESLVVTTYNPRTMEYNMYWKKMTRAAAKEFATRMSTDNNLDAYVFPEPINKIYTKERA